MQLKNRGGKIGYIRLHIFYGQVPAFQDIISFPSDHPEIGDLFLEKENADWKVKIIFTSITIGRTKSTIKVNDAFGILLVKVKKRNL